MYFTNLRYNLNHHQSADYPLINLKSNKKLLNSINIQKEKGWNNRFIYNKLIGFNSNYNLKNNSEKKLLKYQNFNNSKSFQEKNNNNNYNINNNYNNNYNNNNNNNYNNNFNLNLNYKSKYKNNKNSTLKNNKKRFYSHKNFLHNIYNPMKKNIFNNKKNKINI